MKDNKFGQSFSIKKRQTVTEEILWKSHPEAIYKYMKDIVLDQNDIKQKVQRNKAF